jgi:uncharacterized membrane protein
MAAPLALAASPMTALAQGARRSLGGLALLMALSLGGGLFATPAKADLNLCNMTAGRVGIALGYRDAQGWITEGWWNLNARGCETLLKGPLARGFDRSGFFEVDTGEQKSWTIQLTETNRPGG